MIKAHKLPSGKWRARAQCGRKPNGKLNYVPFISESEHEANYLAEKYENQYKDEEKIRKSVGMTLDTAIDKYIEKRSKALSPTTIDGYKKIKRLYFVDLQKKPIKKITEDDIQKEVNKMLDDLSLKTVKNALGLLLSSVKEVMPEFNIDIKLPPQKKKIKTLPHPQELIQIFKGTDIEVPVLLALWMGYRMSEIRGFKISDIKDGSITVNRVKVEVGNETQIKDTAKTYDSIRVNKIPKYLNKLIKNLNLEQDDFIVQTRGNTLYKKFARILKNNGIDHISFHDLRHMNASIMVMLGVPDKYAMERGGWSTDNILKSVYQHTFTDERQLVDKKIDKYFDGFIKNKKLKTK